MDGRIPTVIMMRPDGQPCEVYEVVEPRFGPGGPRAKIIPGTGKPNPRIRNFEYRGYKIVGKRAPRNEGGEATYFKESPWKVEKDIKVLEAEKKRVEAEAKRKAYIKELKGEIDEAVGKPKEKPKKKETKEEVKEDSGVTTSQTIK